MTARRNKAILTSPTQAPRLRRLWQPSPQQRLPLTRRGAKSANPRIIPPASLKIPRQLSPPFRRASRHSLYRLEVAGPRDMLPAFPITGIGEYSTGVSQPLSVAASDRAPTMIGMTNRAQLTSHFATVANCEDILSHVFRQKSVQTPFATRSPASRASPIRGRNPMAAEPSRTRPHNHLRASRRVAEGGDQRPNLEQSRQCTQLPPMPLEQIARFLRTESGKRIIH